MTSTQNDMHLDFVAGREAGYGDEHTVMMPVSKPNLPFFVYGTLRRGEGNYSWALAGRTSREQDAVFVGAAMYDNGAYPFAIREQGATDEGRIIGELMYVPAEHYQDVLVDLDNLEGYDPRRGRNLYQRIEVEVTTASGETVRAYTYVADPGMYYLVKSKPLIPSGDWIADAARFQR